MHTTLIPNLYLHSNHFSGVLSSTTFTLVNNCNYTIWPGTSFKTGGGRLPITGQIGGFVLHENESTTIDAPESSNNVAPWSWAASFWGRTHCTGDSTGNFSCLTGDCGSGIGCTESAVPPVTLAEFNLSTGTDFYDVSLVDGYNLPMLIIPQSRTGVKCNNTGCLSDLNQACPLELKVTSSGGEGVACKSPCKAFGTAEYCCNSGTCKPTSYSEYFKKACPSALSSAFVDETSTFSCAGVDYLITFCPSATDVAVLGGGIAVLSILSYLIFRRWRKSGLTDTKLDLSEPTKLSASFLPSDIRRFSLAEIKSGTNNFDDNLVLGVGGFGKVYKGCIDNNATTVAIKRLNAMSHQGIREFKTEIEMLSKLRHLHLVSLVGCCEDNGEMVLVYDYMGNGTLRAHLLLSGKPAIIEDIPEEPVNLANWARCCYKTGVLDEIIDLHVRDEIAPECLKKFADVAYSCIEEQGINRPSMSDVVWSLELALQLQEAAETMSANGDALENFENFTNLPFHLGEDASTEHSSESLSRSIELAGSSRSSVSSLTTE
ncbi:hypothetical protein LguiA_017307 [Lonicera macranthoides]